jgi:methyltransferase
LLDIVTPHWLVLLVALERVAELVYARRNVARLRAEGAIELGADHYPFMICLHGAWLAALWLSVPAAAPIAWPWFVLYLLLVVARIWVMASLGRYWTTRILHVPGAPLVRRGPYRFIRHPNYAVVAGEIAVLPLVFGAWQIALVFSILNAAMLAWRIRAENAGLATRPAASE